MMKLNNKYWVLFLSLFFIKLVVFVVLIKKIYLGADADYYHLYVLGIENKYYSFWQTMLVFLNDVGFYNREYLKLTLFFISSLFIPLLFAYNIQKDFKKNEFWFVCFIASFYPSLYYFSLDIYRDIFMVLIFLIAITFLKLSLNSKNKMFSILFILLFIGISFHLISWGPYLGAALIVSFFISFFIKYFFVKHIVIFYISTLISIYYFGLMDPLLSYRGANGFELGNTSFHIGLIDKNILEFFILYVYNIFLQLFGIYFVNIKSVFVFLLETVPFVIAIFYLFKNKKYINDYHIFLLLFFTFYTTIWLLGNDNLGTAIRLRLFSYIVIHLICLDIYFFKKKKEF